MALSMTLLRRSRISIVMRELAAVFSGEDGAPIGAAFRAARRQKSGSRYWVAGYPRLLAEWHPTKNGDVFPDEVSYGSRKLLWWKCPKGPDHEWSAPAKSRTTRKRGCPFCANRAVSSTNSLYAVAPDLAHEWHPTRNAPLTPDSVIGKSHRVVWWQCVKNSEHAWRARLSHRWWLRSGCPQCSGLQVTRETALATRFPELVAEWDQRRNRGVTPQEVAARSHLRVWWRSSRDLTHRWQTRVVDRTGKRRARCPVCMGKAPIPRGARRGRLHAIATELPELAREWDRVRNSPTTPKHVTRGSQFKAWWCCSQNLRHRWRATVNDRSRGSGCPFCAGKRSLRGAARV